MLHRKGLDALGFVMKMEIGQPINQIRLKFKR
jgi:hypothetical protein